MYKAVEAIYDNGKLIFPKGQKISINRGKVLVIFVDQEINNQSDKIFTEKDAEELKNHNFTLTVDPLEFQKSIRDEWE